MGDIGMIKGGVAWLLRREGGVVIDVVDHNGSGSHHHVNSPFVRHTPLTYRTRNLPLRLLCPKTRNTGDIFPDVSPFTGIAHPYVRSPLAQRIAASCFVLHLIALLFIVFPLRYSFR